MLVTLCVRISHLDEFFPLRLSTMKMRGADARCFSVSSAGCCHVQESVRVGVSSSQSRARKKSLHASRQQVCIANIRGVCFPAMSPCIRVYRGADGDGILPLAVGGLGFFHDKEVHKPATRDTHPLRNYGVPPSLDIRGGATSSRYKPKFNAGSSVVPMAFGAISREKNRGNERESDKKCFSFSLCGCVNVCERESERESGRCAKRASERERERETEKEREKIHA